MLYKIKARLSIDDNDRDFLLLDLIDDAKEDLKILTNNEELEIDGKAESIIKELVAIKFNSLGSEGLSSESAGGITQNFLNEIPKSLKYRILSLRKLRK